MRYPCKIFILSEIRPHHLCRKIHTAFCRCIFRYFFYPRLRFRAERFCKLQKIIVQFLFRPRNIISLFPDPASYICGDPSNKVNIKKEKQPMPESNGCFSERTSSPRLSEGKSQVKCLGKRRSKAKPSFPMLEDPLLRAS